MSDREFYQRVSVATLIIAGIVVGGFVFYLSSFIFLSALIGLGIATLINPLVNHLENNFRLKRFIATGLVIFTVTLFFGLVFLLVGSVLSEQVQSLRDSYPEIADAWKSRWNWLQQNYPQISKALKQNEPSGIAQSTVSLIGQIFQLVTSIGTGLTLALVMALFTTLNAKKYLQGFLNLFVKEKQDKLTSNLQLTGQTLRKWFTAQLLDMTAVFLLTTIGLWICGIKYWFFFGLLTGLLSIVPYAGTLIVVCLAAGIVIVQQPEKIWSLLIVFIVTQQLEGNLILPKVMKDQVKTPAAPLIFLMILFGHWFGVLGVFVTPPLFAVSLALYKYRLNQ